eukprot:CAMPEP_0195592552 /NCGR_PEP_ID=MMETSP0815-20121206/411_1 /TAXON_ID=97485 /ORGANISM="Prymnesium parvum, Strain Texoma1" /LENGTH=42 /DNA_ID= /DNA_START= /DNA_END= /DNA_ORIENTATION=
MAAPSELSPTAYAAEASRAAARGRAGGAYTSATRTAACAPPS